VSKNKLLFMSPTSFFELCLENTAQMTSYIASFQLLEAEYCVFQ